MDMYSKETAKNAEQVKDKLERKFRQIKEAESDKHFFSDISSYVEYVEREPIFSDLVGGSLSSIKRWCLGNLEKVKDRRSKDDLFKKVISQAETKEEALGAFAEASQSDWETIFNSLNEKAEREPLPAAIHLSELPILIDHRQESTYAGRLKTLLEEAKAKGQKKNAEWLNRQLGEIIYRRAALSYLFEGRQNELLEVSFSRGLNYLDRAKWQRYISLYHSYILDYLDRLDVEGKPLVVGGITYRPAIGQVRYRGDEWVISASESRRVLEAMMEKQGINKQDGLTDIEVWGAKLDKKWEGSKEEFKMDTNNKEMVNTAISNLRSDLKVTAKVLGFDKKKEVWRIKV